MQGDIIAALQRLPAVRLAVAFGSRARGAAGRDLDVAVRLEPDTPSLRFEVEAALGRAAGCPVDLVLLDDAPPLLAFEWWEFRPLARRMSEAALQRVRRWAPDAA